VISDMARQYLEQHRDARWPQPPKISVSCELQVTRLSEN
jgi:hypothetical protein